MNSNQPVIEQLEIKSSDEIKREFFLAVALLGLLYGCTKKSLTKAFWEKVIGELLKHATCYFDQILEAAPHKTVAIQLPSSH